MSIESTRKPRLSLSVRTLIGFVAGIVCGLFFGELCGWLQVIGDAFVGLLQMTVLPYIAISLIASVGQLAPRQARRLCGRVGLILLILWAVGLLSVVLATMVFPIRTTAAFYSNTLLTAPESLRFMELFIPTNPFQSLANNWIPAVVIFCVSMGSATMVMPRKSQFLARLDDWLDILKRLNGYVVLLTPYGVFAIVAAAAGTMTIDELARIQAYLLSYTAVVILLSFLLLPALVASCTPFRYRDCLDVTLQAMITAFATAKLVVVLPMLIEETKKLFERYESLTDEVRADVDVIYPLLYPIPNLGKLATLIFVPFAAWFVGSPMEADEYPLLLGLGSVTYFGKPLIAMPFLLDVFRIPADMFQLFVVADVYCARSGDVLAVMHLFAITVLGTCATRGLLRVRVSRLAAGMAVTVGVSVLLFVSLRGWLSQTTSAGPPRDAVVAEMQLLRHQAPSIVHEEPPAVAPSIEAGTSRLDAIRATGVMRVGYRSDHLPFSFLNAKGELVGLDIELVHVLAEELGCRIEFVPYTDADLTSGLDAGHYDFAVGGLPIVTSSLLDNRYSEPYLNVSVSFVVPDHRRREFSSMAAIEQLEELRIAIPHADYFRFKVQSRLPDAELVAVDSVYEFFEGGASDCDALLLDAESGSAWTFLFPGYRPVVPLDLNIKVPLGFAASRRDPEMADFLSGWIQLKKQSGEFDELYEYWILGQEQEDQTPRWSVINNVLGVDRS